MRSRSAVLWLVIAVPLDGAATLRRLAFRCRPSTSVLCPYMLRKKPGNSQRRVGILSLKRCVGEGWGSTEHLQL